MRSTRDWRLIAALGCLGWVVLYAGRAVLSPVLGTVGRQWQLDASQLGLLSSVFFVSYVVMQIPAGLLADKVGKKGILVAGFALFGLATVLRGLAPTYGLFLAAGALAGVAQGTYYASMFAIVTEAVPARRRSLGSAVVYSGMALGTSAGFLLASVVASGLGWSWRTPFVLVALPAAVMVGLFVWLLREPQRGDAPTPVEQGRGAATPGAVFSPRLVRAYVLNFTSLYPFFVLLTWLPYYLEFERGLAGPAAGLVASLFPWASIPTGVAVSLVSDRTRSRIAPLRWLLLGAAVAVVGIGLAPSGVALYAALLFYGILGKTATDPLLAAEVAEHAPTGRLATALSILNFVGVAAAVIAPYVTGLLIGASGDMRSALYLAAAVLLAGFGVSLAAGRASLADERGRKP